jgi:hypothetical protein
MDRMRTPLLISLILLGSSTAAFAQANPQPAPAPQPPAPATSSAEPLAPPPPGTASPVPAAAAAGIPGTPAPQTQAPGSHPEPASFPGAPAAVMEPPSVIEVGVQRLPASAYPEFPIRGLKYSSLWLTFHGLQWPYMPSFTNGERFVIGLSGWGWIDTAYQKFAPWGTEQSVVENDRIKYWKQQARMLLRMTPTYAINKESFIQGQVELVGTGDQSISRSDLGGADTDDLWLRAGQWRKWDVQVGRFEGWEVFHLGMGLDQNTFERRGAVGQGESAYNIGFYGVTDNQFRPAGSSGNLAVHLYPLPILRFELLGMTGYFSGPAYAVRPVAILDLGWLKLKFATEYQNVGAQLASDQTDITSKGIGGAVQFVFAPHVELGLNAAQGTVWNIDGNGRLNTRGSLTRTSFGGFANFSNGNPRHPLLFGVGSMVTFYEDQYDVQPNPQNKYWLYQGFVAAQYVLHSVLYIKLVGGYSRGHWDLGGETRTALENEMYSLRLRFAFYF